MIKDPFLKKKWNLKAKYLYENGRVIGELGELVEDPCPVSWCTHPLRVAIWPDGREVTLCMGSLQERPDGEYDVIPEGEVGE